MNETCGKVWERSMIFLGRKNKKNGKTQWNLKECWCIRKI